MWRGLAKTRRVQLGSSEPNQYLVGHQGLPAPGYSELMLAMAVARSLASMLMVLFPGRGWGRLFRRVNELPHVNVSVRQMIGCAMGFVEGVDWLTGACAACPSLSANQGGRGAENIRLIITVRK